MSDNFIAKVASYSLYSFQTFDKTCDPWCLHKSITGLGGRQYYFYKAFLFFICRGKEFISATIKFLSYTYIFILWSSCWCLLNLEHILNWKFFYSSYVQIFQSHFFKFKNLLLDLLLKFWKKILFLVSFVLNKTLNKLS